VRAASAGRSYDLAHYSPFGPLNTASRLSASRHEVPPEPTEESDEEFELEAAHQLKRLIDRQDLESSQTEQVQRLVWHLQSRASLQSKVCSRCCEG
jgi:hypothetical protein